MTKINPKPEHKRMMLWIRQDMLKKLKKIAGRSVSVQEVIRQILDKELK